MSSSRHQTEPPLWYALRNRRAPAPVADEMGWIRTGELIARRPRRRRGPRRGA